MAEETKEETKKEEQVEPEKKEEEKVEAKPAEEVKPEEKPAEEPKPVEQPEPKPEPAKVEAKPEPSGKFKELIKQIEGLTTLELSELVKALEERFGVSAAAPMAMAAGVPAAGAAEAEAEEKSNYTVVLADSGAQKIAVIKALREIKQDLGLKEAKDIADAPPKEILKDVPKEEAETAKKKLEAAGAKVELK